MLPGINEMRQEQFLYLRGQSRDCSLYKIAHSSLSCGCCSGTVELSSVFIATYRSVLSLNSRTKHMGHSSDRCHGTTVME